MNKPGKLDELEKFLETHKWSKLTQEEIEDLNKSVTNKEMELVAETSERKAQEQTESLANSTTF